MNGKTGRFEAERMLLIALLAQQLHEWLPGCQARSPAQLLDGLPENLPRFHTTLHQDLLPYLTAMRVDAANTELLMAIFDERLRSAADVLERILRHRIEAAKPEDYHIQ